MISREKSQPRDLRKMDVLAYADPSWGRRSNPNSAGAFCFIWRYAGVAKTKAAAWRAANRDRFEMFQKRRSALVGGNVGGFLF